MMAGCWRSSTRCGLMNVQFDHNRQPQSARAGAHAWRGLP